MTDYAEAMLRMFHRNIEAVAGLPDPRTTEPARARRIIALLVETLGGFAYGTVAGQLVRAVATWFGAERAALVRSALPQTAHARGLDLRFDDRPLLDDLVVGLRARVTVAARDLDALHSTTVAMLPADHLRMSGAMFIELNRDSVFDDRLEIEIRTGWTYACAAIERRYPQAPDISPRASNLWASWSRLAGNPAPDPARNGDHLGGYIVRVG